MIPTADDLATDLASACHNYNQTTERGLQKLSGRVGISDIGGCREQVRYMTVEEAFSDDPNDWAAFCGTALGKQVEEAVFRAFPDVLVNVTTLVTLPSGSQYPGHPDLVVPKGGVIDVKSVDGITSVQRHGPDLQQQYQRHLYAGGLVQEGRLPPDCWVANAWFDRSGRNPQPHVDIEPYDESWLHRADEWLSDVVYAVQTGEHAQKDKPLDWCQKCCEFFTKCRGEDVLRDSEHGGLIEDPELIDAIGVYAQAQEAKKEIEEIMDDARRQLANISGRTPTHVVKWTYVGPTDVPGHTRAPYSKLNIRPIPRVIR